MSKSVLVSLWTTNFFPLCNPSHRQNVPSLSLLYRDFHEKCSDELHSLVPVITIMARTRHATIVVANQQESLRIWFVRSKFHSNSFPAALWRSLRGCLSPDQYNLNQFKSRGKQSSFPSLCRLICNSSTLSCPQALYRVNLALGKKKSRMANRGHYLDVIYKKKLKPID